MLFVYLTMPNRQAQNSMQRERERKQDITSSLWKLYWFESPSWEWLYTHHIEKATACNFNFIPNSRHGIQFENGCFFCFFAHFRFPCFTVQIPFSMCQRNHSQLTNSITIQMYVVDYRQHLACDAWNWINGKSLQAFELKWVQHQLSGFNEN